MILLDVNVLIYAHRPEAFPSRDVTTWLSESLVASEPVAVWDVILTSAYRILTHPKLVRHPNTEGEALTFLTEVRDHSIVLSPGQHYWDVLQEVIKDSRAVGNLVSDAAIAALAIDRNCRLATFDRDFARFKGLNWFEPLKQ